MALFAVSCSSSSVNDFKVKSAEKAGMAVEKNLQAAYLSLVVVGVDCNAEAVATGEVAKEKILELLKAKEVLVSANLSDKNFGSVVPVICSFVVSNILPDLIKGSPSDKYACLRALGADKMVKVSNDLCESIKI